MNGACGHFRVSVDSTVPMVIPGYNLKREVRAGYSRGLEDHAFRIIWIYASVRQNAGRVDDVNIKVKAASSATQAEHAMRIGLEAYCRFRLHWHFIC